MKSEILKNQHSLLGKSLKFNNMLTDQQIDEILSDNGDEDMLFGEIAVKLGYLDETEVMQGLSEQQMVPYVDLNKFNVDHNAVQFLDKETARKLMAIPLFEVDDILAVGLSNASDIATLDELELKTGKTIQAVLCSKEALKNIIQSSYSIDLMDSQDLEDKDDSVIIELVQKIIEEAVESNASDIHIQPSEFELDIRYRIDGVLQSIMVMPNYRVKAINSRLKVMSNLDIAESRKPQDGRFKHQMPSGKVFDFRISTYPTEYGEKTVMRILDPSKGQISLDKLGFSAITLKKWQKAISNSTGIILVTGPTGSGKSTTLYATLGILNSPDVNIITVEDPVEYNMKGIAQGQLNEKAGMTFAASLSSMLRQDPDIIMVGEMRDVATIELAVRAALTGHLVLSTLHTNDTASSYSRLLDMGMDPFLVTATVRAIIAQRLIRQVCQSCKQQRKANEHEIENLGFAENDLICSVNQNGCQNCGGKGYKGRTGLYELLIPSQELNALVNDRRPDNEIKYQAIQDGMSTLTDEAKSMVMSGATSVEEISRVI